MNQRSRALMGALFLAVASLNPVWAEGVPPTGPVVDINHASADELAEALSGVGQAKAEAIIREREQGGPFADADDLRRVKGVGPALVERNRTRIRTQ